MRDLAKCINDSDLTTRIGEESVMFLRYLFNKMKIQIVSAGGSAYRFGDTKTIQFLSIGDTALVEAPARGKSRWMFASLPIAYWWPALETGKPTGMPAYNGQSILYPMVEQALQGIQQLQGMVINPLTGAYEQQKAPEHLYDASEFVTFRKVLGLMELKGLGQGALQAMYLTAGMDAVIRAFVIVVHDFQFNSSNWNPKVVEPLEAMLKAANVLK
jgi:hypothetical protein